MREGGAMTPETLVIFAAGIIAGAIATVIGSVILQALMACEDTIPVASVTDVDWVED